MSGLSENVKYTLLQRTNSSESEKMIGTNSESEKNLDSIVIDKENHLSSSNMKHKNERNGSFFENFTTVVHILLIQFVIYILYLSFSHEVELFTWHPILLSVGWSLLMTEAIIALSPENCLTKVIPKRNRILIHWILQGIAGTCILTGFIIVIVNKNLKNKNHFVTWHATMGLVSIIFMVPTFLNGILTLYKVDLRNYIHPVLNKVIHIVSGCATFILGTITVVLSLYSNWFTKKTGYTSQVVCFIAVAFVGVWVLIRPTKYLLKNIKFR